LVPPVSADDSTLGIAIGNFANEMNALYVLRPATRDLVFTDGAVSEGLGPASRQLLKFGLFFFDYRPRWTTRCVDRQWASRRNRTHPARRSLPSARAALLECRRRCRHHLLSPWT
jgi:hypothetical protein